MGFKRPEVQIFSPRPRRRERNGSRRLFVYRGRYKSLCEAARGLVTGQGQRQPATRAYGTNARRMSVCVRREALCRQMDDILLAANIKMLCSGTQYGIISPNDYGLWSILPFREEFLQWECGFGRRPPAFQDERRRPVAGIRRLHPDGRQGARKGHRRR